jgi:hypothetical protein
VSEDGDLRDCKNLVSFSMEGLDSPSCFVYGVHLSFPLDLRFMRLVLYLGSPVFIWFSSSCAQAPFYLSCADGHDFLFLASVPWQALVSSLNFFAFVSSIPS